MNTIKEEWEKKARKDLDTIRDIILDMNKNRNEVHYKVMRYMNKIAKLCYKQER